MVLSKHGGERLVAISVLSIVLAGAVNDRALAFPTWMGILGSFQRHDSNNPGTFTILMNEDYYGLEAELGMEVAGGDWHTYPMNYISDDQGNSLWQLTPEQPFAVGAVAQYYFHGWDGSGSDIYDNNGGNNYSYLSFLDNAQGIGVGSSGFHAPDLYVTRDMAFIINSDGYLRRGSISTDAISWDVWRPVGCLPDCIAANDQCLIIVAADDADIHIFRSLDFGATFKTPITISVNSTCVVDIDAAGRGDEFVIACTTDPICYPWSAKDLWTIKSTDAGLTWGAPVLADHSEPWIYELDLQCNDDAYYLKYATDMVHYTHAERLQTSPDGLVWTQVWSLFGGMQVDYSGMAVGDDRVIVLGETYYPNVTKIDVWDGSSWTSRTFDLGGYSSSRPLAASIGVNDELYFFRKANDEPDQTWSVRQSFDDGVSWSTPFPIAAPMRYPDSVPLMQRIMSKGGRTHVAWFDSKPSDMSYMWQVSLAAPLPTPTPTGPPVPASSPAGIVVLIVALGITIGTITRTRGRF